MVLEKVVLAGSDILTDENWNDIQDYEEDELQRIDSINSGSITFHRNANNFAISGTWYDITTGSVENFILYRDANNIMKSGLFVREDTSGTLTLYRTNNFVTSGLWSVT